MAFFTFHQNNSHGIFKGPQCIIIEAKDEAEALEIAEKSTEIYFDGCDKGSDCSCCGDRWSRYCEYAVDLPENYGQQLRRGETEIYYLDGSVRTLDTTK